MAKLHLQFRKCLHLTSGNDDKLFMLLFVFWGNVFIKSVCSLMIKTGKFEKSYYCYSITKYKTHYGRARRGKNGNAICPWVPLATQSPTVHGGSKRTFSLTNDFLFLLQENKLYSIVEYFLNVVCVCECVCVC